jgi:nicotinamide-nucleotide amidase
MTNVPGASEVFLRGYVTYSNAAKVADLGVAEELLDRHGAVSEPVARAMAEGCLARSQSDFAIAVTGIAGPGGGTAEKPVGTVFIALAGRRMDTVCASHRFARDRETFKQLATQAGLDMLRREILRVS